MLSVIPPQLFGPERPHIPPLSLASIDNGEGKAAPLKALIASRSTTRRKPVLARVPEYLSVSLPEKLDELIAQIAEILRINPCKIDPETVEGKKAAHNIQKLSAKDFLINLCKLVNQALIRANISQPPREVGFINILKARSTALNLPKTHLFVHPDEVRVYCKRSKTRRKGVQKVLGSAIAIAFPCRRQEPPKISLMARLTAVPKTSLEAFIANMRYQHSLQHIKAVCQILDFSPAPYEGKHQEKKCVAYAVWHNEGDFVDCRAKLITPFINKDTDADALFQLNLPFYDGMIATIATLHSSGVIHYDIKPENFLLRHLNEHRYECCVTDLNHIRPCEGTDFFLSPELLDLFLPPGIPPAGTVPATAGPHVDVWALGISLHFFYFSKFPEFCQLIDCFISCKQTYLRVKSAIAQHMRQKISDVKNDSENKQRGVPNNTNLILASSNELKGAITGLSAEYLAQTCFRKSATHAKTVADNSNGYNKLFEFKQILDFWKSYACQLDTLYPKNQFTTDEYQLLIDAESLLQEVLKACTVKFKDLWNELQKIPEPANGMAALIWAALQPDSSKRATINQINERFQRLITVN